MIDERVNFLPDYYLTIFRSQRNVEYQFAICMQNTLTQCGDNMHAASPSEQCTQELSRILLDFRGAELQVDCRNKKYEQLFQATVIKSRKNKEVRLESLLKS